MIRNTRWETVPTAAVLDHSHGNPQLNLTNLSGTTASASSGFSLSLSAAAPGAGGGWAVQGSGAYTQNTGTIQFANSNGITFGLSTNQLTASHNGLTTARASNDAVGLNTAATSVTWTVNSSGISLNAGAYLTTAAASNHTHGSGPSITGPVSVTSNSTGWSISLSNYLTTARASNDAVGLNTAATGVTWTVNSSGISLNAGAYLTTAANSTHSHGNPTLALTNLSGTTASASNGFTLSLSAAAPGGGGGAGTGTALNLTNLTGTLSVNTAGVSLSMSAAAPGGGGGVNRSFFELMDGERITTCALLNNATYSNRPIFNPFWMDGSGLTCNTVRFFLSRTGGTSLAVSIDVGFYTIANATSMNLISSTRHDYSLSTSAQFSGIRGFDITGLGQAGFSLSEGRYVLGFKLSMPATASGGLNIMGGDAFNNVGWVLPGTDSTAATATGSHILPFWGVYSATSANLPAAVGASQISGGNSARNPDIYAVIKEI